MVSIFIYQKASRKNMWREQITISTAAAIICASLATTALSGCSNLSAESNMRSWQELRKSATVKYGQAQDRGALSLYVKALQQSEAMGMNSITRSVSLNELSQIILVTGDKMPVQEYIDATMQQSDYWLKTDPNNAERLVSLTELSEALLNFAGITRANNDAAQAQKLDERAMQLCQSEAASNPSSSPNILLGYRWGRIITSLGQDYLAQSKLKEGRKALHGAMESPLTACVPQAVADRILKVYSQLSPAQKKGAAKTQLAEELGLTGNGEENSPISQWSKYMKAGKGFLLGRGDASSAIPMFEKAVVQAKKTSDPDIPAAESLHFLGSAYEEAKKPAQAEAALLEAVSLLEGNSAGSDDMQNTLGKLVQHYQKQKQFDKSEEYAVKRITVINSFFGEQSTEAGLGLIQLAEILRAKKQFAQAEAKGQEALTIVSKNVENDDARLALTKTLLASIYIADKKYSVARPILADAMKIWTTQRSQNEAAAAYADGLYEVLRKQEGQHAGGT